MGDQLIPYTSVQYDYMIKQNLTGKISVPFIYEQYEETIKMKALIQDKLMNEEWIQFIKEFNQNVLSSTSEKLHYNTWYSYDYSTRITNRMVKYGWDVNFLIAGEGCPDQVVATPIIQ
jgi:hypothetical protein